MGGVARNGSSTGGPRGDAAADAARGWTAARQGRAIGAGTLDPLTLAEAYLDAAARHPDGARVYARLTHERALAEATAARTRAQENRRLGVLDGVAISWKDLVDVAGTACEAGSRLLSGRVPEGDALAVTRATASGTVCLGKTHLSELAFSGLGINPMAATAPQRWDQGAAPGGSSSGAAASVFLDLAAMAIGSDTGGSVRIPAAWNDLVGLKTTAGLIPLDGCLPLATSLDTLGPLARSVEDVALGLGLLTGTAGPAIDGVAARGLTLHVPSTVVLDGLEDPVGPAFEAAVDTLAKAGCRVTRGPLTALAEVVEAATEISPVVTAEGWQAWGSAIAAAPDTLWPPIEARFRAGQDTSDETLAAAKTRFDTLRHEVEAHIAEHGLLVLPTVPCPPPKVARVLADAAYFADRNLKALSHTRLFNLMAMCALTLPTGTPSVGLMLVAPAFEEARLIAAGRAIERVLA
ncbi:MAG: amidase family protein [Pseudomonadota bacterium]